jgi:transposase
MAYLYGNRYQTTLFPESIEDYVSKNDPVRAYDAFVEKLDLKKLGMSIQDVKVGNPAYNPKAMIKLLLYGYSYGIRSSRKLERACTHNISFIWLMEGLKPDHKTIAEARKNNKMALKNVMKQCARFCIKLELIEGNTLFVDGSKIRANASINTTVTKERAETLLQDIDNRIQHILNECDTVDEAEQNNPSLVKLKDELKDHQVLRAKIDQIMNELNESDKSTINATDPECVIVAGRQGTHAGYNSQIVVDEKHGLIVHTDVVNESNDRNQFSNQIAQANEILDKKCRNASADAGYANVDDLKKTDRENIRVIVPSQKQARGKAAGPFDKEQFEYDATNDCYICPEGHQIPYSHFSKTKNHKLYRGIPANLCLHCQHFGVCTTSPRGRAIIRLVNEETKIKLEKQYNAPESQKIFKLRKQKVELPFGHIKRNLGVASFLLRGLEGARAEMALYSSCFNIARMLTLWGGVSGFIAKMAET